MKNSIPFMIFMILGVIATFLIFLQAVLMTQLWLLLPLGLIASALMFMLYRKWFVGLKKNKTWAIRLLMVVAALHVLPVVLALLFIIPATWGNIFIALVGILVLYFSIP
jgi:hypothetical protein